MYKAVYVHVRGNNVYDEVSSDCCKILCKDDINCLYVCIFVLY